VRTLQLQASNLTTRDSDDGAGEIDGIAVPYNQPIDYAGIREQFAPGSFAVDDVIGRPLLWSHDRAEPIGHIREAANSDEGLQITAVIQPTSRGRDALALLRGGSIGGLSVGFTPDETATNPHGVTYTRATLYELSVVAMPAYESATVTATREEEVPPMSESTETREAPQVDLAPIAERIDQLEARLAERHQPAPRTLGVVDGFVAQLRDAASRNGQMRALADVVSSGNAGVLPPAWSSEVRGYIDAQRYLFGLAGSMAFPSMGHTLTVPKRTQSTTVGARGTEKTEVPSQAYTSSSDVFQAAWYAGAVDVALEVIWQSDPAIWSLIVQDMLEQYAVATDSAFTLAAETAATPTGSALDTSGYAALIADLIDAGEAIRAATGMFGDVLSATTDTYKAILGLVDGDNRRIFATTGSSNADGSAALTARTINVGGILIAHNPRAAEDMQFNTKALRVAEKPPVTLQTDNVALMGRDIGILGAIITLPLYPAGILVHSAA